MPEGFQIDLVASEPVVKEPSGIAFDEHGRVFVCELHGYNIEGHIDTQELNKTGELDKTVRRIRWEFKGGKIAEEALKQQFGVVKLLIDTDGDGVMDKAEVWADDLPPCYGIVAAISKQLLHRLHWSWMGHTDRAPDIGTRFFDICSVGLILFITVLIMFITFHLLP